MTHLVVKFPNLGKYGSVSTYLKILYKEKVNIGSVLKLQWEKNTIVVESLPNTLSWIRKISSKNPFQIKSIPSQEQEGWRNRSWPYVRSWTRIKKEEKIATTWQVVYMMTTGHWSALSELNVSTDWSNESATIITKWNKKSCGCSQSLFWSGLQTSNKNCFFLGPDLINRRGA